MSDAVPESREAALRYWAGDDRNFVDNPACHAKTNELLEGDTWRPNNPPAFPGRISSTRNPLLSRATEPVRDTTTVSGISFALSRKVYPGGYYNCTPFPGDFRPSSPYLSNRFKPEREA